jgi:phosphoribosyl-ATP pyrophosphohydrolase
MKNKQPKNAYEYADWLYNTSRLTAEEHLELKRLLRKLEEGIDLNDVGC